MNKTKYTHRILARLIVEAKTPLSIGTGVGDVTTDSLVARDVNGLPYIPGATIAGVIRSQMKSETESELWGYQNGNKGKGAEISFTEAKIIDSKNNVADGVIDSGNIMQDPLLQEYTELPIRQHVRINESGVASSGGKFDEEIVYKGTRFCFEIEIVADSQDKRPMLNIIDAIRSQSFRIGGGTRKGYGKIEVASFKIKVLNLRTETDLRLYLDKPSNLNESQEWWNSFEEIDVSTIDDKDYVKYRLEISPQDFVLFSSGFGSANGNADKTSVKESVVKDLIMRKGKTLIPATSVKGALRHRVAFHYNKNVGLYFGKIGATTASHNPAVKALFGYQDQEQHKGNVFISDVFEEPIKSILVSHVSIDRFTGGAKDGALFTEQTDYGEGKTFFIEIDVNKAAFANDSEENPIQKALEEALIDICKGQLPLGGSVNRGNGIFTGKLFKQEKCIYEDC